MEEAIEWLPPPASKHIGWSWGWIWGWKGTPAWILSRNWIANLSRPSLHCYVTAWSQRVHTQQTGERGRAGKDRRAMHFSLWVKEHLCRGSFTNSWEGKWSGATAAWTISDVMRQRWCFFFISLTLCIFDPPPALPFWNVLSIILIILPPSSPCYGPVCLLCFYSGSMMGSPAVLKKGGGWILCVSLIVRAHVMSS